MINGINDYVDDMPSGKRTNYGKSQSLIGKTNKITIFNR